MFLYTHWSIGQIVHRLANAASTYVPRVYITGGYTYIHLLTNDYLAVVQTTKQYRFIALS